MRIGGGSLDSPTSARGWLWTVEGSLMAFGSAVGGWIATREEDLQATGNNASPAQ